MLSKPVILLADDDADILRNVELLLQDEFEFKTAISAQKAKALLEQNDFDTAVIDLNFEGQAEDGVDLLKFLFKERPKVPVVVLSNDANTKRVVTAASFNLAAFVTKDGDIEDALRIAIRKALATSNALSSRTSSVFSFQSRSPKIHRTLDIVDRVSKNSSESSILILGESGSGKEYLARHIAARLRKPIVSVNMANVAKDTAESELFGHVRGAFTGAISNKIGLIESAKDGIFFLDELGECSLDVQAKLLRAIQEKEIQPLGAMAPRPINVRFIGATHQNLEEMVKQGRFRMDLFHRLNVIRLELSPLRERPEDIIHYANCFLNELSPNKTFQIESSGVDAMLNYKWPGNVRELRNVIERLVIYSDRRTLDGESFKALLGLDSNNLAALMGHGQRRIPERSYLLEILKISNGNRSHAADRMGVHRVTLQRWIREMQIEFPTNTKSRTKSEAAV